MNYSEVKELLAAGFTADEIRGMMNNPQNTQNNPQPAKKPETEHFPEEPEKGSENIPNQDTDHGAAAQDPAVKKEENTNDPRFEALNNTMERLIRTIQSSNLHNSTMDTPSKDDINKQVDSIMSSIIRPPHNEKEETT